MIDFFVTALLFFLPAGVANATPPVANRIPVLKNWKTPMDFGRSFRGKRILGDNKTWRGFVTGTFCAGLTAMVEALLFGRHNIFTVFLLGATMGCGALFGDAVESFAKRQRGIPAGQSWFPFDQIDYIIGGLIFVYPFTHLPIQVIAMIFVIFFGLHLAFAYIGYLLKLKDSPI